MSYKQTIMIKLEVSKVRTLDRVSSRLSSNRSEIINNCFEQFYRSFKYTPDFKLKHTEFDWIKCRHISISFYGDNNKFLKEVANKAGVPKVQLLRDIVVDYIRDFKYD